VVYMCPDNLRAQELLDNLAKLLDKEAVTDNIDQLKKFIQKNSDEILDLDMQAMRKANQMEEANANEKEKNP